MIIGPCLFFLAVLILIELRHQLRVIARLRRSNTLAMFGNPYVTLRGGVNQFMEPQFELNDAHANYAAGLQSGMRISLICTGRGDVAKTPMSKDCAPGSQ